MIRAPLAALTAALVAFGAGCTGSFLVYEPQEGGAPCELDIQCRSGTCTEGVCTQGGGTKANGEPCTMPSECSGGFCVDDTCASEPAPGTLTTGSACTVNGECVSDRCELIGDTRRCTEDCTDVCPGGDLACFEGRCVPEDFCENASGMGEGPGCEDNRFTCESCADDATCVQSGTVFRCECNAGFLGSGFECIQDDCFQNPCQNGAQCLNDPGAGEFRCLCPSGFGGDLCEIDTDDCPDPDPCQNGGTCIDGDAAFTCMCASGWEGTLCDQDIDECASANPCQNGGTCVNEDGSFSCSCPGGFDGGLCENNIDDCPSVNPCQNGGTCVDGIETFTCSCPAGFDGSLCENNIDDCTPDPCVNGGTCVDQVNNFFCSCPLGYAGQTCANFADCSANGDLDCAESMYCDSGTCAMDTCTPNALQCNGTTVERCEANGSVFTALFTCLGGPETAANCVEPTAGDAYCECQDDWDCPLNTECNVNRCDGTGQAPTCSLPPSTLSAASFNNEITWGGTQANNTVVDNDGDQSPFDNSGQVVLTPVVANLTDDNNDGFIDERDFPEIVFLTFCDSVNFRDDGILRAIHGGGFDAMGTSIKGKDYFANCAGNHWIEGDALPVNCDCGSDADLNATSPVAVGDLDYDGVPEIVAVVTIDTNFVNGFIRIYSNTGEIISTSAQYSLSPNNWNPGVTIANLDNTGFAEIVVGNDVFTLYDNAGTLEVEDAFARIGGEDQTGGHFLSYQACIADLIGDARLEVITGSVVYSLNRPACAQNVADCTATCTAMEQAAFTTREQAYCNNELWEEWRAGVGGDDGFCAVADVLTLNGTNDGFLEPSRSVALDGRPELVMIQDGDLRVYDVEFDVAYAAVDLNFGSGGGPPNIDDFDGDGFPEVGSAGDVAYAVYDFQVPDPTNCPAWTTTIPDDTTPAPGTNTARTPPVLSCTADSDCGDNSSPFACNESTGQCICLHNGWRRATEDDSSRATGSSVFDFNGDGAAEVVYNDECKFRVYDGLNSNVILDAFSESRTRTEYPIVADVDNDGNAEIIFGVSNESGFCGGDGGSSTIQDQYNNGIEVWGDVSDAWVSARRIWNQHAYHVTNITESGHIPLTQPKGWLIGETNGRNYNSYRSNPRSIGVAPDLIVESIQVASTGGGCGMVNDEAVISVKVTNQGDLRVGAGVILTLEGDFGMGFVPLLQSDMTTPLEGSLTNTLDPKNSVFLQFNYDAANNGETQVPTEIRATIDPPEMGLPEGRERECLDFNNDNTVIVGGGAGSAAELTVSLVPTMACNAIPQFDVTVVNDGTLDASNVVVRFYAGNPNQGGTPLLDNIFTGPITAGDPLGSTKTIDVIGFPQCVSVQVYAVVDPDNAINECNDGNNSASQPGLTFCCPG